MNVLSSRRLHTWVLIGSVLTGAVSTALGADAKPQVTAVEQRTQIAAVEQLKAEAYQALRDGKFDRTNELMGQAADLSKDPAVQKMAVWTKEFEAQRQTFAAERRKQYDKAVAEVQLLLKKGKEDYAIDVARNAYLLAEDKKAFRLEKWVDDLINDTARMAEEYEKGEQWLRALRLYSDLSSIEPANPEWKDRLKTATRRIRLLALYTPSELKSLQEVEIKNRKEVDDLLKATTQPAAAATKPAAAKQAEEKAAEDKVDSFTIDWRESLKDIRMDMLWDALVDARTNYFRDASYRGLALGGLKGLQILTTTRGLEKTFTNLGDREKRQSFLKSLDECVGEANASTIINERMTLQRILQSVKEANKESIQLPEEVLVSEFADGAFAELDPFSSMIWPSELEEFNKTTQGEFTGVGIQIQNDEDGSLKVVSPLEDSPAYRAGIKAGDIITHIDSKSAKGITLNQAVKTITGAKGTTVRLTVRSPDRTSKEYPLVREVIKVGSIKGWLHRPGGGWDYFVDPDNKIAYLRLTNFTKTTTEDLDRAADDVKAMGARAIILDLRYNPGGLLTAATEVSDKFLHNGVIVSTKADRDTPNQPTVATAKGDNDEITLPTVVLVNQYSASASEIVSGALKDQKRALVVGERTFGKGSVQMLFPLSDRRAYLKLTTSHYYLPSGRCIHREENSLEWGVDPDVTVEMTPEQMRAAIDARQDMDILRDVSAPPAEGAQPKLEDNAAAVKEAVAKEKEKQPKDPLACDPQLSAALLLLRLELAGAHL